MLKSLKSHIKMADTASEQKAPVSEDTNSTAAANNKTADEAQTEPAPAKDQQEAASHAEAAAQVEPKEMRAVVLNGVGSIFGLNQLKNQIKVQKRPEPSPAEGEVLIRVKACALSFADILARQGFFNGDSLPRPPYVMGFECSGQIEQLGPNCDKELNLQVGDQVVALAPFGACAELVSVSTKYVYKLPSFLDCHQATAITLNYVVAYALLMDVACLRPNQTILIHNIGGGVGHALAQLVKLVPDITVIGTASKGKHDSLKEVSNHLLDYSSDWPAEVKKISPDGVHVILDCIAGEDFAKGFALLRPMGRYVVYGTSYMVTGESKSLFNTAKTWLKNDKVSPMRLFEDNKTISGFNLRNLLYKGQHEYVRELVNKVFKLYEEDKIKPTIDSTWAFEDIADALQLLNERKNVGKLLVDPAAEPRPKPKLEEVEKKKKNSKEEKNKDKLEKQNSRDSVDGQAEAKDKSESQTNGDSHDSKPATENGNQNDVKENGDAKDKQ